MPGIPLVSCIMPTFGRPEYVDEAVAMFLAQDYPEKELIVLNDCPGQTFRCDLPGVRVINSRQRYPSLGEKRNAAIEMASGGMIAVWDDDDVHLPWRLSFSVSEALRLNTEFYRPAEFWAYWGGPVLHDNQAVEGWVNHGTALFSKDLWRRVGGYPPKGVGEDADFFARIHRELGKEFIKYPLAREDRFYVLRGKSHYQHMSITGGEHPLDTTPQEREITPLPVRDPVLSESCDRLAEARCGRLLSLSPIRGQQEVLPVLTVCVSLKNRSKVIHEGGELRLFPNCVRALAEAAAGLSDMGTVELVVSDFASDDWPLEQWLANKVGCLDVRVLPVEGDFSRGRGLNLAVCHSRGDAIFLCDADMLVSTDFLRGCIRHAKAGSAYFPIMRYLNPDGSPGDWEHFGYGMACLSKRVLESSGGVPEFTSWGGEDDIFFERVGKLARIVRETVPGLLHQWHPEDCRHKYYVRPRKCDFEEHARGHASGGAGLPSMVFWAEHPDWQGFLHLYEGGRMARPGIDGGEYELREKESLLLRWDRWSPEPLAWDPDSGMFVSREKPFSLRQRIVRATAIPPRQRGATLEPNPRIVRTIHVVWVGDESMRPDPFIDTWRILNPQWNVRVWGNHDLATVLWKLREHLDFRMHGTGELHGVADIMRWEILFREGGFAIDADGPCLRPLEDWLFEGAAMAACLESEVGLPGVIANGYVYARPQHPVVGRILRLIGEMTPDDRTSAFRALGPGPLTTAVNEIPGAVRIWPSHYFIPNHRAAPPYRGDGPVFAMQHFMSTHGTYGKSQDYRVEDAYKG